MYINSPRDEYFLNVEVMKNFVFQNFSIKSYDPRALILTLSISYYLQYIKHFYDYKQKERKISIFIHFILGLSRRRSIQNRHSQKYLMFNCL